MYYVYIIKSEKDGSYYTGMTKNLRKRLKEHNEGKVKSTSFKNPYILVWYCAFPSKEKAIEFEKYLKTGSGIAFRNKRLL